MKWLGLFLKWNILKPHSLHICIIIKVMLLNYYCSQKIDECLQFSLVLFSTVWTGYVLISVRLVVLCALKWAFVFFLTGCLVFYFACFLCTEQQFYDQFTLEEKMKLYDAIGYQENEADPTLPKDVGSFIMH